MECWPPDALNAECTVIALSGHGCFVSLSGSKTEVVPKYFNQILYKNRRTYAFPSPDPDAVIVHLGTNDYAMNVLDADFYTAYQAFVRRIRREYPKAYIVLAAGGGTTRHLDLLQRVARRVPGAGQGYPGRLLRRGLYRRRRGRGSGRSSLLRRPPPAGRAADGVFEGNPELVTRPNRAAAGFISPSTIVYTH